MLTIRNIWRILVTKSLSNKNCMVSRVKCFKWTCWSTEWQKFIEKIKLLQKDVWEASILNNFPGMGLPRTNCAPLSRSGRPWLKLMLMSRQLKVICSFSSVFLEQQTTTRFAKQSMSNTNRSVRFRSWLKKSWPNMWRQATRRKWEGHKKGLVIHLSFLQFLL